MLTIADYRGWRSHEVGKAFEVTVEADSHSSHAENFLRVYAEARKIAPFFTADAATATMRYFFFACHASSGYS